MGLHDPLYSRQACHKLNSFHQEVGHTSPERRNFRTLPYQNGDKFLTSPPPLQSLEPSKMEFDEHPRHFFLRVDRLVKEMERERRSTSEKDIDVVLLSGLSS